MDRKNKRAGQKVSIKEECPHRRSVHKGELYCIYFKVSVQKFLGIYTLNTSFVIESENSIPNLLRFQLSDEIILVL